VAEALEATTYNNKKNPTLAQASTLVPRIKECKATTVKGFGFHYT